MWFDMLQIIGIISFSISGAMAAIKKRTDIFGVVFLGIVTAFGGGFIRDLTLGQTPPSMFFHARQCLLAMITACLVFVFAYFLFDYYQREEKKIDTVNNFFDAIGLGTFSVVGTQIACAAGFGSNVFLSVCMGMITGMGGGILRDLLVGEIPFVLRKRIYALASIAGAAIFYLLDIYFKSDFTASLAGVAVTFGLRMLATHYKWNLPKAGTPEECGSHTREEILS